MIETEDTTTKMTGTAPAIEVEGLSFSYPDGHEALREVSLSYSAPESAVRALARVVSYAQWAGSEQGVIAHYDDVDRTAASDLVRAGLARNPDGGWLTDDEVHRLLAMYGIDLWDWEPAPTLDAAIAAGEQFGWNVVLKATADTVRARPDLTHVWRNIGDADDMREAWTVMTADIGPPERAMFVVQKMAPPGVPMSIRTVEDPLFGPVLSFALSGAAADLLEDRSYRIPPVTDVDVASMIRELKSAPLLFGYRGGPRADLESIEDLLQRVAALKDDLPEVSELSLEPVVASPAGHHVLKARARVAQPTDTRRDWYVRRLSTPVGLGGVAQR